MSSFPVGKYARYKRATTFFLDWLLRAQALSRHVGQHLNLNSFSDVVQDVAQDPSSLTPKLLSDLPKALAIYFLGLLKSWHAKLKTVQLDPQQVTAETESTKFENYYEVLEVDEDYFPDDTASEAEPGASEGSLVDRVRLFNEAFAEDLRLEVVYFFLELEELVEGVFSIYDQVKKEQRTMVEATVAVKVAMDAASALTAKLQLRYPALKTAEDVGVVLMDNLPKSFWGRAHEAVVEFWKTSAENGAYTFVPGMLVVEFRSMLSTLCSFTTGIPTNPRHGMVLREGFFGETYGEERTPEYAFPDTSSMVILLLQQLPHLYNAIVDMKRANGGRLDTSGVTGPFMGLLNEYFTSRTVTVPLVFACICWVKSVAALQGNSGLSRNVGVTIKHTTDLLKRIKETAGRRAASFGSRIAQEFQKQCDQQAQQASLSEHLARANPLMAGFMMLTFDLQYWEMARDVLETTSRFRAFCHLYNALVDQGFLEPIPFFNDVLDTYESWIFTPSRKGATRGMYNRTYLLSSHYTAASISEMYRSGALPVKSATGQGQKRIGDFSTIYRLMNKTDKAFLRGATSKAMLNKVADICAKELFQTRVLSRDLLSLNDDLTDVCNEMADQLNQQRTEPVENAAMMFVMPFLDGLQPNGSMNMDALPGAQRGMRVGAAHVTIIKSMCAKAAAVIRAKFASPPLICEQKYFTFPSKPDFATQGPSSKD